MPDAAQASSSRKLAAIFAANFPGYIARMSVDEEGTIRKLNRSKPLCCQLSERTAFLVGRLPASCIGRPYLSGRTRAWLKTKNPNFQRS
jgi:hypothetical protein